MYIVKNALKCIGRSKGRNILIGVIALVIALSACLGLSIRQAAQSAKDAALEGMSVTATISFDRQAMMSEMEKNSTPPSMDGGGFDRESFSAQMGEVSSLTLSDYEKYATASTVQDFYYTATAYLNESDSLLAVSNESDTDSEANAPNGNGGTKGPGMQQRQMGDFTVLGYSSDLAMTEFLNGTASVTSGAVFEMGTEEKVCLVSEELATYNSLSVGDVITLIDPSDESVSYSLTVVGIYASSSSNEFSSSPFGASQDPANRIYMSAAAMIDLFGETEGTDSTPSYTLNATYVFADVEAYERFEEEVREMGLPEEYTVSSSDLSAFENSIAPLETLSTMAGWFLLVILIIGAIILIVLNIFNVRERKYEIGVLTAMGMKKWKVATQFLCEILAVVMVAVLLGAAIGAVSSVPLTNALLEGQIESQSEQKMMTEESFGRPQGGLDGNMPQGEMGEMIPPDDDRGFGAPMTEYISEIDSAMNLTVVWQMLGIGLLLSLFAGAVSILFVMRYDPLKILANRD